MRSKPLVLVMLGVLVLLAAVTWNRTSTSFRPVVQDETAPGKPVESTTARSKAASTPPNRPAPTIADTQRLAADVSAVALNAHLVSYEGSDNLAQLVAGLDDDVRTGDTRAAWVVFNALHECDQRFLIPSLKWSAEERARRTAVEVRESTLRHLSRLERRCSQVSLDQRALGERLLATHAIAVAGDDLVSQATRLGESPGSLRPNEAKELLRRIVQSRDPWAIWAMADTLNEQATEYGYDGPYANGMSTSRAWKLVACRLGYPCGPDSAEVRKLCAVSGRCIGDDYEGVLREYEFSPQYFKNVIATRDKLLELIAAGDYHATFP